MLRVITICEKNVVPVPAKAITVAANKTTVVVPDLTSSLLGANNSHETAAITIQNTGTANDVYYAFGQDCDNVTNFHGLLQAGVMLNCPTTQQVSVFTATGTTIAVCILKRIGGL